MSFSKIKEQYKKQHHADFKNLWKIYNLTKVRFKNFMLKHKSLNLMNYKFRKP
jgi:hypothetical protein